MSLPESIAGLLADEATRRREFPVAAKQVYLAHAAVCPLPAHVVHALSEYLTAVGSAGQFEHLHATAENEARRMAAQLIEASPDEIAFAPSTSAGLGMIAAGLPWRSNDSLVIAEGDFPSNVYPWQRLRERGVTVRAIPARATAITWEDVSAQLDDTTRLVALSSVHYATGARIDIDRIGKCLNERGILFCVDAIQSLGALPTSARHVDFMVADAHKWLLGPQGIALLYVRRSRFELLEPLLVGWKSVRASKDFVKQSLTLADTARRYEPGSLNALGVVGLHAALQLLQHFGVPAIAQRLVSLRAGLSTALQAKGYEVLGAATGPSTSGILSFRHDASDMRALHRALDREQVIVSLRQDPSGRDCLRVAPHFYNTSAELERLLALL
jgi:selenocysteine lyase/cysteine desulfurase